MSSVAGTRQSTYLIKYISIQISKHGSEAMILLSHMIQDWQQNNVNIQHGLIHLHFKLFVPITWSWYPHFDMVIVYLRNISINISLFLDNPNSHNIFKCKCKFFLMSWLNIVFRIELWSSYQKRKFWMLNKVLSYDYQFCACWIIDLSLISKEYSLNCQDHYHNNAPFNRTSLT